jgi:hypothetical protein
MIGGFLEIVENVFLNTTTRVGRSELVEEHLLYSLAKLKAEFVNAFSNPSPRIFECQLPLRSGGLYYVRSIRWSNCLGRTSQAKNKLMYPPPSAVPGISFCVPAFA